MLHLNFITRTRIRIYIITCFTNPSPCSPFDGTDGFFIYIRTFATITATLQRKHIIQGINGLWWQIICNGQWSSATPPWQMWQMGFNTSATGTHWFSGAWNSVADVYVILDDKTKTPYLHVLTNRQMRQGRFFNAPRRIHEFVKEFSSKHQGLFQKVLHLFEKVLSSVWGIIFEITLFFLFLF